MTPWRGTCITCGHGRGSTRWTQYPQGYPVPDGYDLPAGTDREAARLCRPCYREFSRSTSLKTKDGDTSLSAARRANATTLEACTPLTVTRPQRRRESPTMAVPGRSESVQQVVSRVVAKLGPHASVPVDRLLVALVSPAMARCGLELDNGSYCDGMRGLIERECTKVGSKITLTLKCSSCCARSTIVSSADTGLVTVPDGEGGTVQFRKSFWLGQLSRNT